jgi:TonB family protein
MTGTKKNRILKLTEFLSYLKHELTGRERNSFERELEKDPFAAEAMEGFDEIGIGDISGDMEDLQQRLKKRVGRNRRVIIYRIAATIALFIAISSLFILTREKKPTERIAENFAAPETLEVKRSQPVVQSEIKKLPPEKVLPEKRKDIESKDEVAEDEGMKNEQAKEIPGISGERAAVSTESKKVFSEPNRQVAPASAAAREKSSKFMAADAAISAADSVQYVIISAYNIDKAENEGYYPPLPVNGKDQYDRYIRENIKYPGSYEPGQKIAVILSFLVRSNGQIENIKVESSPDKSFSDEAISLVKNGPAWKPAEKDGRISEDEVKVTIVFR